MIYNSVKIALLAALCVSVTHAADMDKTKNAPLITADTRQFRLECPDWAVLSENYSDWKVE